MEPFDIELGDINYAVFPEGDDNYVIFKNGKEYVQIQKDDANQWIKFHPETGTAIFEYDEEVNQIGHLIEAFKQEPAEQDGEELID